MGRNILRNNEFYSVIFSYKVNYYEVYPNKRVIQKNIKIVNIKKI